MNKVKKLEVKNFTCFKDLKFDFENINVIIGENGVGKTHLLKLLFTHLKAISDIENYSSELQEKIEDTFFIENIKILNRNKIDFEIKIETE